MTFLTELPQALRRPRGGAGRTLRAPRRAVAGAVLVGGHAGSAAIATAIRSSPRRSLEVALAQQARLILAHYLERGTRAGRGAGAFVAHQGGTRRDRRARRASADDSPHRVDEPYRRALIGIYARLARDGRVACWVSTDRRADGRAAPIRHARRICRRPRHDRQRARSAGHGAARATGRLRTLRRAVSVFGFHLAPIDLRQNSDVHEAVVAELLARAGVEHGLRRARGSRAQSRCSHANSTGPRLVALAARRVLAERRAASSRYSPQPQTRDGASDRTRCRHYVISTASRSRICSRSACC